MPQGQNADLSFEAGKYRPALKESDRGIEIEMAKRRRTEDG